MLKEGRGGEQEQQSTATTRIFRLFLIASLIKIYLYKFGAETLRPISKQNIFLFIQPRWQLRRTYLFNHYNVLFSWMCIHRLSQTQNSIQILGFILRLAIFTHVYFAKNVAYFPFNSWLSFQRLRRLLWGCATMCTTYRSGKQALLTHIISNGERR